MTLAEAAERYGKNAEYLRVAVNRKVLPAEKIGKTWVVKEEDMEAYASKEHRRGRPPKALPSPTSLPQPDSDMEQ